MDPPYRYVLAVTGLAWLGLAIMLFLDVSTACLLPAAVVRLADPIEGLAMLSIARSGRMRRRNLQQTRAAIVIVLGLLVVFQHDFADIILAIIFGPHSPSTARCALPPRWSSASPVQEGGVQRQSARFVIAIIIFLPWPFYYTGTVDYCIALALSFSGWSLLRLYLRLRACPRRIAAFPVTRAAGPRSRTFRSPTTVARRRRKSCLVRVWTA
jgi:uncharacterized membrane protein HdeD (DUF308 family)